MWRNSTTVDVRVRDTDLPTNAVLHLGSAAVAVRARPLGADTARLSLDRPLPVRIGDRGVLRDPGATDLVGGVIVLDPRPVALGRRGSAALRAQLLDGLDGVPDGAGELARRGLLRADELLAMGAAIPVGARRHGDWLLDPATVSARARALTVAVRSYARKHPIEPGMPLEAARRVVDLPTVRLLDPLLADRAAATLATVDGRLHEGEVQLPAALRNAVEQVRARLTEAPFAAPEANELTALELGGKELGAAVRAGLLRKITSGIYLLPDCGVRATELLAELPTPFTLSQARQALGTTRRVAVPLLELLAREGITHHREDGTHELR